MADAASRKRAAARAWLTRASNALSRTCEQYPVDTVALTDAVEQFDIRWNNLLRAQEEYENFLEPDQLEIDIDEAAAIEDRHRKVRIVATRKLHPSSNAGDVTQDNASSVCSTRELSCSLPKLELSTFDGKVTEWQGWWDQFVAVIDESDLPDISKFLIF